MPAIGIIGVDPGKTTGLSWGLFNPELRDRTSLWNAVVKGRKLHSLQIGPDASLIDMDGVSPGDTYAASLMVADKVVNIIAEWNIGGLSFLDTYITIEDFEIRVNNQAKPGASARTGLSPVFISGVLFGALTSVGYGERISYVKAGVHKSYATDERLKRMARASRGRVGWVRGRPHARDSWRLIAWTLGDIVV